MHYAIIENGVVANIIIGPLPNGMDGVFVGDRPVAIGDQYTDGVFYRNGVAVLTDAEKLEKLLAEYAELAAAYAKVEEALNG